MENNNTKQKNSLFQQVIKARYGNNILKLVEYAKTIKDRNKRNLAARQIIEAMRIINKEISNIEDYEKILWNHLAILSNYELDIDYPYEIIPMEDYNRKPQKIDYPNQNIRFRHYGKIIEELIEKAINLEDEKAREELIKNILIQMKRSYLLYAHAGDYVKDDVIFKDFERLSQGKLKIPKGFNLPHSKELAEKLYQYRKANVKKNFREN